MSQTDSTVTATATARSEDARLGYTSPIPWADAKADVIAICCSSEKFNDQNRDFLKTLGFKAPHCIQVPSGPALLHGLTVAKGFVAKAMSLAVEKAVDLVGVPEVICIGHENCGGYKTGRVALLGALSRRLVDKDLQDVQIEHLRRAARELQLRLGRSVTVSAYFARIVTEQGKRLVRYEPVDLGR